ncbi:YciI family protein [Hamadaea sp.]|uniref:YciI family protein n=1 Tax=Hamadaea sp. TaxID=2024425 RepID=UPI0025B87698|nr:YciI family protein [Hamadaea sp.]
MKTVVIGASAGRTRDEIMAVYPRHKQLVEEFQNRGEIIGIGPFTDGGNMAIFRHRAAAEEFAERDPFALEGLVSSYELKDWADEMLS